MEPHAIAAGLASDFSSLGGAKGPAIHHDGHFLSAAVHSVMMVIATEIGDKTFFIAAILAMTKNPFHVWTGAWGALVSMTVLSALIGLVLPALLSREYTHWASTALFLWFGVKALVDARELFRDGKGTSHSDEFEEAQAELAHMKDDRSPFLETLIRVFLVTFVAEWGDKSQIATIAMGAARCSGGIISGGVLGHALCTGLAVCGGQLMASKISERQVVLSSGALFLGFAAHGCVMGPEE